MSRIQLALRHLTSDEADHVWAAVHSPAGSDLADNLAVTIASWWQSPGRTGWALAALASGAPVSAADVIADVDRTVAELEAAPAGPVSSPTGLEVLAWLRAWAQDWGQA